VISQRLDCENEPEGRTTRPIFLSSGTLHDAGLDIHNLRNFQIDRNRYTVLQPRPIIASLDKSICILCVDPMHHHVQKALQTLQLHEYYMLDVRTLGEDLPSGRTIVCLIDLEAPFLYDMTSVQFANLKKTILSGTDASMLWVTGLSQIRCTGPNYALSLGFCRTVRRETAMNLATLELQDFNDEQSWEAIVGVLERIKYVEQHQDAIMDNEYVFYDDQIRTCRFKPVKMGDIWGIARQHNIDGVRAATLNTLSPVEKPRSTSSGSDTGVATPISGFENCSTYSDKVSGDDTSRATGTNISAPVTRLRSDRAYLLVGGGGGIGQSIARWMVENGAQTLVFFSRNASRSLTMDLEEEFQAMGATTIAVNGSSESSEDVMRAAKATELPIGGVVHAAMVLNVSGL
jgi:hypothetical protein